MFFKKINTLCDKTKATINSRFEKAFSSFFYEQKGRTLQSLLHNSSFYPYILHIEDREVS